MNRRARWRWTVAGLAALALLACVWLGWLAPRQMLLSYLAGWLFWLAPAVGSVALLMVHALTGGDWGHDLRPVLLAGTRLLPLLALLGLPLIGLAAWLYPWAHPSLLHGMLEDPQLARQRWYLNLPFFIGRGLACLAAWLLLAWLVRRRVLAATPMNRLAALGLIVYAVTVTVAGTDWIMSLVPVWHSSAFGITLGTSQMLGAAALATLLAGGATRARGSRHASDLGMLLMALMLGWAYLMFMDYLTAWIGDLPSETRWYLPRVRGAWGWVAWALLAVHLVLPFALLLWRRAKRSAIGLRVAATLLLLGQLGWLGWLVLPSFRALDSVWMWAELPALLGIGGLCWATSDLRPTTLREGRA